MAKKRKYSASYGYYSYDVPENPRNAILSGYTKSYQQAVARDQVPPTMTEYMLRSNPGNNEVIYKGEKYYTGYANADSARRQAGKLREGSITGEKMHARGTLHTKLTERTPEGRELYHRAVPAGGRQYGLWKIVVHLNWRDSSGQLHEDEQRSFIAESSVYDNYFDATNVEVLTATAVEDHVEAWEDEYGVSEVEILYVEVIKIVHTHKEQQYIVNLDEMELYEGEDE